MDTLPDLALLQIFASLADGVALLDVIPLVCKRWHRLARHPYAWANVELAMDVYYPNRNEVMDDARILLHAPCLRSLEIEEELTNIMDESTNIMDEPTNFMDEPQVVVDIKASAIRRCAAAVREVRLRFAYLSPPTAATLDFIWSKRDGLESFTANLIADEEEDDDDELEMDEPDYQPEGGVDGAAGGEHGAAGDQHVAADAIDVGAEVQQAAENGRPLTYFGVIAGMRHLTDLQLTLSGSVRYDGEYAGDSLLPNLRHLAAEMDSVQTYGWDGWYEDIILDLLRGAHLSLRSVVLTPVAVLPADVEACLGRCLNVRTLHVNLMSLAAARHLVLDTLRLHFHNEPGHVYRNQVEERCRVLLASEGLLGVLRSVRVLGLDTIGPYDIPVPSAHRRVGACVVDLLLAVARAATSVTDASLFLTNRTRLHEVLAALPRGLVSLEVSPFGDRDLATMAGMQKLRELNVRMDPGFCHFCSADHFDHCKKFIKAFKKAFKKLRPDVYTQFRLEPYGNPWYGMVA